MSLMDRLWRKPSQSWVWQGLPFSVSMWVSLSGGAFFWIFFFVFWFAE
jgi:hypothetical protein